MASQPIDYLSGMGGLSALADPTGAIVAGLKDQQSLTANDQLIASNKLAMQGQQQALTAAQAAQARNRQKAADIVAFNANPTADGALRISTLYPEDSEPLKRGWDMRDKARQQTDLTHLGTLMNYVSANQFDKAIAWAQQRRDADFAAKHDVTEDDHVLDMLKTSPTTAKAGLMRLMAAVVPDKFAESFSALSKDEREAQMQPVKLAEATAEATTKGAEAAAAPGYYAARAAGEQGDAQAKQAEGRYRGQMLAADVKVKGAQLADYNSQIAKRAAEVNKSVNEVTVDDVKAPIAQKIAAGIPLTPGENAVWTATTNAPASVRRRYQPAVAAPHAAAPQAAAPAAQPAKGAPVTRQFRNRTTGAWENFQLVGGQWVKR